MKEEPFHIAFPGQEQVPDERDADGLPRWVETAGGWSCGDWDTQAFAVACLLDGFNLPAFDTWLSRRRASVAKEEMLERRSLAFTACRENNTDRMLRHLEYLLLRSRSITREEFLLPMARHHRDRVKRFRPETTRPENLDELMAKHKGNKSAVAREIGVDVRQVRRWVNGK